MKVFIDNTNRHTEPITYLINTFTTLNLDVFRKEFTMEKCGIMSTDIGYCVL